MKRLFSFLILMLLLVNLAGFYGYFIIRLQEIHEDSREAISTLPESALQKFHFTKAEFLSILLDEREIKVDGKMYDIAYIRNFEGGLMVFALHDEAEDDLLAFINEVMSNASKDGKIPSVFSHFIALQFVLDSFEWNSLNRSVAIEHQTSIQNLLVEISPRIQTPPPQS